MRAAGGITAVVSAFKRMNGVDWAQLHAKAAAALWAIVFFIITPQRVSDSLGAVLIWVMTSSTLLGAVVSIVGLVMAARHPDESPSELRSTLRRTLRGLAIELLGIAGMLLGIALYFLTQAVLSFGPEGDQRVALTVFVYFTGAMLVARLVSVRRRRRKEVRAAKAIGGIA
ncbi:hypothetical protein [Microbacterium sp. NPDC080220]|uniref:hypothetical protein n=1 Tax=Microbacterium sp. NPDC080220 TaxID=3161017 RepID=UPI00342FF43E